MEKNNDSENKNSQFKQLDNFSNFKLSNLIIITGHT